MKSSTPSIDPVAVRPTDIRTLFTNITPRYDILNTVLSFQLDAHWRNRAVDAGLSEPVTRLLDVGTGTGKLLGAFLKRQAFGHALGLDLCESMLAKTRQETRARTFLTCADSMHVPLRDASFDLATSSFTLRSIPDLSLFFRELFRVLAPGGRIVMLELTRPKAWWLRLLYFPYLHVYLPLMGRLLSGDYKAYRFLARSIYTFKQPHELLSIISGQGFTDARDIPLSGGLATLFIARKPKS